MDTKFTLELKGYDIPDDIKADISKALNDTFMKKIGEINLIKPKVKLGRIIDIHGGRLHEMLNNNKFSDLIKVSEQINTNPIQADFVQFLKK